MKIALLPQLLLFVVLLSACTDETKPIETKKLESAPTKAKVSIAEVEEGIRAHIKNETDANDGYFHIETDTLDLNLKLVRVHTEYLSVLGPKSYFACVDLADSTGDVYDVDFFLKGEPGNMNVSQTTVHKLNGKPYYTWKKGDDKVWRRVPVTGATSDLLGVIEGNDHFTFRYALQLPKIENTAQMWIPIPQSDEFQTIELVEAKRSGSMQILTEPVYGNTIQYFELTSENSGDSVVFVYDVRRTEKGPYAAPKPDLDLYLTSSLLLPTGGRFSVIADSVLALKQNESNLMKARALYDYIIDNLRYAKQGKYGTGDANYACDSRSGNCTEFHSLFISLARSSGIPARFAIGAAIPSNRDNGGVDGYHCWAEFYAEGKWWPVDISEGNKYTALATYYFGHHPANRIEFTRGRDFEVDPRPAAGSIPFLAYPLFEKDGQEIKVKTKFTFKRY